MSKPPSASIVCCRLAWTAGLVRERRARARRRVPPLGTDHLSGDLCAVSVDVRAHDGGGARPWAYSMLAARADAGSGAGNKSDLASQVDGGSKNAHGSILFRSLFRICGYRPNPLAAPVTTMDLFVMQSTIENQPWKRFRVSMKDGGRNRSSRLGSLSAHSPSWDVGLKRVYDGWRLLGTRYPSCPWKVAWLPSGSTAIGSPVSIWVRCRDSLVRAGRENPGGLRGLGRLDLMRGWLPGPLLRQHDPSKTASGKPGVIYDRVVARGA